MKRLLNTVLVLILAAGLLITGCSTQFTAGDSGQAPQVGRLAPDFRLTSLAGDNVSLSDLRGKAVLINFWASWCPPCRAEMPYIQEIYEGWTGKTPSVAVLGINIGENLSTVENFMQGNNLSFTVLLDSNQDVARRYNVTGIPITFFINEYGIIEAIKIGAFSSTEEIEKSLREILP